MKKLTIGMCTYDDFHGVYFSIQSLRMYHEIANRDDVEFIVVDNNPTSKHGEETRKFMEKCLTTKDKGQYIPYTMKTSTSVRNEIFSHARGQYTLCMDCHVMFMPGAIDALLDYFDNTPNCIDIVQGPMMYESLNGCLTHFKPIWGEMMYGKWGTDHEGLKSGKPFDIPMQGLGMFACETENWRKFNKHFKGFGGEEGYIHEKFRQYGGRSLCIPQVKWLHRFARPDGVQYPLALAHRVWNYYIGWLELGDQKMVEKITDVFAKKLGKASCDVILEHAKATLKY